MWVFMFQFPKNSVVKLEVECGILGSGKEKEERAGSGGVLSPGKVALGHRLNERHKKWGRPQLLPRGMS